MVSDNEKHRRIVIPTSQQRVSPYRNPRDADVGSDGDVTVMAKTPLRLAFIAVTTREVKRREFDTAAVTDK